MAEPAPNRIDVHPRTQKVSRAAMSNRMWTDALSCQGGQFGAGGQCVALHQGMNAEAANRMAEAIQEDGFIRSALSNQDMEFSNGNLPQWAKSLLSPFSSNSSQTYLKFVDLAVSAIFSVG